MKKVHYFFAILFVLSTFSFQANAQIDDSLPPYFKINLLESHLELLDLQNMQWEGTYDFAEAFNIKAIKSVPKTLAKSLKLERNVKKIDGPIILQKGGKCYRVACAPNDCRTCTLFWNDTNRDGKVQPAKEIRCICIKTKQVCTIRGKQIECKD